MPVFFKTEKFYLDLPTKDLGEKNLQPFLETFFLLIGAILGFLNPDLERGSRGPISNPDPKHCLKDSSYVGYFPVNIYKFAGLCRPSTIMDCHVHRGTCFTVTRSQLHSLPAGPVPYLSYRRTHVPSYLHMVMIIFRLFSELLHLRFDLYLL